MTTEAPDVPSANLPPPEEMIASTVRTPVDREFVIKRPGHIAWVGERGNYPGCRLLCFSAHDSVAGLTPEDLATWKLKYSPAEWRAIHDMKSVEMGVAALVNEYFKWHSNLLVVDTWVDIRGSFWCLVTNQLEDEEFQEFQEFQRALSMHMEEWRKDRTAREEAKAEAARVEEEKQKLYNEVGRRAVEHNLFKKLRDLEEEVQRLSRELKNAKRVK